MSKYKKADGLIKQLIITIGLGITLLFMALFASGIFFTGVVVENSGSTINKTIHK